MTRRIAIAVGTLSLCIALAPPVWAGSIFLTGHDPDWHAVGGADWAGAQNFLRQAVGYVTDPAYNPYKAAGVNKFLFVESSGSVPAGSLRGTWGLGAAGFSQGVDYDQVDASGLNAALNALGTQYNAIVVASDYGCLLTQAELDILNSHAATIAKFINSGGGLFAMAETNEGPHLTPNGGYFKFVSLAVGPIESPQEEKGVTLTPFGQSLGLTSADVNGGNWSHGAFTSTGGLTPVDLGCQNQILSLAGRVDVQVVPEPASVLVWLLLAAALVGWRRLRA